MGVRSLRSTFTILTALLIFLALYIGYMYMNLWLDIKLLNDNSIKKATNIQAWLEIEDTLSIPILKVDDFDFLKTGLEFERLGRKHKTPDYFGWVASDKNVINASEFNCAIVGHNVPFALFGKLNKLTENETPKSFYIYSVAENGFRTKGSKRLTYDICSVYFIDSYDVDSLVSIGLSERKSFITELKNNNIRKDISKDVSIDDSFITLYTCKSVLDTSKRLCIVGVLRKQNNEK